MITGKNIMSKITHYNQLEFVSQKHFELVFFYKMNLLDCFF